MEALLLAGGIGSRLRPLTDILPKCLMPIHGKPLLGLWLSKLQRAGVSKVFVNLHYKEQLVRDYIEASAFRPLVSFVQEPELLGTAGTLRKIESEVASEDVMVIHADNVSIFDLDKFLSCYHTRPDGCDFTLMSFATDEPRNCGILEIGEDGLVAAFDEKPEFPKGNIANGAVYVMRTRKILGLLHDDPQAFDLTKEVLANQIGKMNVFHNATYHRDIGNVTALCNCQMELQSIPDALQALSEVGTYWTRDPARQEVKSRFQQSLEDLGVLPEVSELFFASGHL